MNKENSSNKNKTTNNKNNYNNTKKTNTKEIKNKKINTKSKDTKKEEKEIKKSTKEIIEKNKEIELENEIDEDLEEFEESYEETKEIKTTPKKEEKIKKESFFKKNNKEKKENKIKKIEKTPKEKIKKTKRNNNNLIKFGNYLEKNRYTIYSFVLGVLVTIGIAIIIWPERIATLKNGEEPVVKVAKKTYTADDLYKRMKDHYSVSQLLDKIDDDLLTKMYPETEEMIKEVKENAEYYINMYKQYYNYTEEQFLSSNGFSSHEAFLEYLKLENRRKKYLKKYIEDNLTDKEIEEYYKKNVYGDINCQHILVETTTESSDSKGKKLNDEEGKKLAQEIIDKINDGKTWEDIKKEYKEKITFEDLKYQSWDSDLEDSFKTALREMDDKSYSKEPVKTSYGYHVIYRIDQKKTPTLKKVKSKIVDKLVDQKQKDDSNVQYKALINLRKEKNIKFYDTDMQKKYDSYIKQYK